MTDLFSGATAQITPFNFGEHAIRTTVIDETIWFACTDVAKALGYRDASSASQHLDSDEKRVLPLEVPRSNQSLDRGGSLVLINESGLYALVLRSRKPEARKFAKWVTSEVLPSIRKTGSYSAPVQALTPSAQATTGMSLPDALRHAARITAEIQALLVNQFMAGNDNWKKDKWMVYFLDDIERPVPMLEPIQNNEFTMSFPQLIKHLKEDNAWISTSHLANLVIAGSQALADRTLQPANQLAVTG